MSCLFSWHPFFMTLSFSFFMTEAILLFSPQGSLIRKFPHKTKGQVHWILQSACLCCAILGVTAIIYNKYLNDKPHFTSWHGLLGVITVFVVVWQSLAAVPLIYHSLVKGWSLAKLKRYHAASGLVTYLLGSISLLFGLNSTWFTASVSGYAWYLSALCPALTALVVMNQVTGAYMARKRLQS
ncbi:transmembrane reductase CYB561D2 isoform X2 [Antennarius striatus]|uniref:transmembrane reductase CYB561D2 isoform X2 n=1 Tax=Antennarius striatus TaxID=241820 RepID=UPI0035B0527B